MSKCWLWFQHDYELVKTRRYYDVSYVTEQDRKRGYKGRAETDFFYVCRKCQKPKKRTLDGHVSMQEIKQAFVPTEQGSSE